MAFKKLAIGNDHTAVEMRKEIQAYLEGQGYEVISVGTDSTERFNYPVSGYKVAKMVASGEVDGGILICGTGVGISLAANKVKGIRAVVCSEPYSARLSRQHNNTNIVSLRLKRPRRSPLPSRTADKGGYPLRTWTKGATP